MISVDDYFFLSFSIVSSKMYMLDLSYYIFLSLVLTFYSALLRAFLLSSIYDPLSLLWDRL